MVSAIQMVAGVEGLRKGVPKHSDSESNVSTEKKGAKELNRTRNTSVLQNAADDEDSYQRA